MTIFFKTLKNTRKPLVYNFDKENQFRNKDIEI